MTSRQLVLKHTDPFLSEFVLGIKVLLLTDLVAQMLRKPPIIETKSATTTTTATKKTTTTTKERKKERKDKASFCTVDLPGTALLQKKFTCLCVLYF